MTNSHVSFFTSRVTRKSRIYQQSLIQMLNRIASHCTGSTHYSIIPDREKILKIPTTYCVHTYTCVQGFISLIGRDMFYFVQNISCVYLLRVHETRAIQDSLCVMRLSGHVKFIYWRVAMCWIIFFTSLLWWRNHIYETSFVLPFLKWLFFIFIIFKV